jgi:pSer/pThr/pTyr-binding forkhead associated (FHA) protein
MMEERTLLETSIPTAPGPSALGATAVTQMIGATPAGFVPGGFPDATQQAIVLTCPVCTTPNAPADSYCQDCGFLLSSAAAVEALQDVSELPRLVEAGTGREFVLNPGNNLVGREGGEIYLAHPTVSRRHAHVILEDGRVTVEDLGSSNGSTVGGRPLRSGERAEARHGDTLKFGSVHLAVTLPGGATAAPAASAEMPGADRGPAVGRLVLPTGSEIPLYLGSNSVGRRSTNQIVIQDPFVSGAHGEIVCGDGGVVEVIDRGSSNGSFMNGSRLNADTPYPLTDGMEFTLGKTALVYRAAAPDWGSAAGAEPEATLLAEGLATFPGPLRGDEPTVEVGA